MTFLCSDYTKIASMDDRIKRAFKELTEAGMPAGKARSVIAVSTNESGVLWTMNRPVDLFFKLPPCVLCRQIVGFEPNGQGLVTMPADPNLLRWMQDNKVVSGAGVPGPAITTDKARFTNIARWFEAVVNARDSRSLWNFSIGPTQMFMGNSSVANKNVIGHHIAGFPESWEDIWSQYMNSNAGETVPSLAYLNIASDKADGAHSNARVYPADAPADRNNGIMWLSSQVGNAAGATDYWDGTGRFSHFPFGGVGKAILHINSIT